MNTIRARYKDLSWKEVRKVHPLSKGFYNNRQAKNHWEQKRGKEFTISVPSREIAPCGQPQYDLVERFDNLSHWMCSCIAEIGD